MGRKHRMTEEEFRNFINQLDNATNHYNVTLRTWSNVKPLYETREDWLHAFKNELKSLFGKYGHDINGNIRISCGFPRGRKAIIGQCWNETQSKDGHSEIFISPVLDDPLTVSGVLVHELIHAIIGVEQGHNAIFGKLARQVGLIGKLTATEPHPDLMIKLTNIFDRLGNYPHAMLKDLDIKKQTTRLIKASCPICGYTIRIAQKWIDEKGLPICPDPDCECALEVNK